jgi:hypothetical protein
MSDKKSIIDELNEVLRTLESVEYATSEHAIADRIRKFRADKIKDEAASPLEVVAELMAFDFTEDYQSNTSGWGTYYGPKMVLQDESGQWIEAPSIRLVSDDILNYWRHRAETCKHPVMQARYADLVWDFSRKVANTAPTVTLARIVIDASVRIAEEKLVEYDTYIIKKLRRSLSLSLSIGDKPRIGRMVDTILKFEDRIAVDSLPGLWGFSFDLLIGNKKIDLQAEQIEKIINDLEQRLERISNDPIVSSRDPFSAEAVSTRLAKYYRTKGRNTDAERIIKKYMTVFVEASENASPLVAASWLKKVYEVLLQYGLKTDADHIAFLIKKASERTREEMQAISHSIEISTQELEEYLEQIVDGTVNHALDKIALRFLPRKDEVETQLQKLAEEAPLQSSISMFIQDKAGRTVATIGPLHEDPEGRIIHQIDQNLQFEGRFLYWVLNRAIAKYALTAELLCDHLAQSPIFTIDRRDLILRGLAAHLQHDFYSSCCILIPEIEACLRMLLHLTGGSIYKPSRSGGLLERTLEEIIRDNSVSSVLGIDIVTYFATLLTDQRGWNLRNRICHGLMPASSFGAGVSNRILHALLILSLVRPENVPAPQEVEEDTLSSSI